jgi:CubicO group peptidase (beta-lactamase class C family)
MTHVSGYRDYFPLDFIDREMKQPAIQDDVIARYGKRPLDFEPRTRFSYSNTGYKILGRVIEKVTRRPLGTVLSERILRPVGMGHSSYMPGERLRALGEPSAVDVEDTQERGGMEETMVQFTFGAVKLETTMFRSVDGKVQQFLITKP